MAVTDYSPPVSNLFTVGDPRKQKDERDWADYRAMGLVPEDVPELVRLARDWPRHWRDAEAVRADSSDFWAPLHAWRAIGQLGAAEAVGPLLEMLTDAMGGEKDTRDDWSTEELRIVFAKIGPAAIPALDAYLAEEGRPLYASTTVGRSLSEIGQEHADERPRVVEALSRVMGRYDRNSPELNGFILGDLLDVKAVEAAPVIREAFRADRVDETIAGGWGDVRKELKLPAQPDDPPDRNSPDAWREKYPGFAAMQDLFNPEAGPRSSRGRTSAPAAPALPFTPPQRTVDRQKEKERSKRKQAKAARKQNRRRR